MSRRRVLLLVALLVLSAGCSSLGYRPGTGGLDGPDRLGVEDGYRYDAALNVTTDDGLNESERRAVVGRAMARVERIRGLEFEKRVPVRVISREQYRESRGTSEPDPTYDAWNEQVWEAMLLIGEDRDVSETFDTIYGSSVAGFYSPSNDEIVIISDAEQPTLDTRTLAHELMHALQDQRFSFGPRRTTLDGRRAAEGLTEGDANLVESIYSERCASEWACLDPPARGGDGGGADINFGAFLTLYTPYAEGPDFVASLRERCEVEHGETSKRTGSESGDEQRESPKASGATAGDATRECGGWNAVNDAYGEFPESTEQVIHPGRYPEDAPTEVTVPDRSNAAWHRFDLDRKTNTLGEGALYALFYANGLAGEGSPYNYTHPASAGWDGDTVVPYTNGDEGGYVWTLTFDSPAEAREFRDAYVEVLRLRTGERVGDATFVVREGSFADAFRVTRSGDTVTIVNGPTVEDLNAIHG